MFTLPTPLPIPLNGEVEAGAEKRTATHWVEPVGTRTGIQVVPLPLTIDSSQIWRYMTTDANGTLNRLWIRREPGDDTTPLYATLYVNGAYTGDVVTLGAGVAEAEMPLAIPVTMGQGVYVFITGGGIGSVSGVLRCDSTMFRLLPASLAKMWVMSGGVWLPVTDSYVMVGGTWQQTTSSYVKVASGWTQVT
jgi:hypothetical protein